MDSDEDVFEEAADQGGVEMEMDDGKTKCTVLSQ